ncbi:MAG: hypothetical protein J7L25_14930 [Deltaproteobacteria bacterium]|nr:hypothetical protein [Candidatus Tharpella aukensis]
MNILEAVANWYGCPYGLKNCKDNCSNYMMVDPRTDSGKGVGPSTTGQRTLCSLFEDMDDQIMRKTDDKRLEE